MATPAKGDGPMGMDIEGPMPANLTDQKWKHRSTDGDIFTVIRDGVDDTEMKNFRKKLTDRQIWELVHYIRSIAPNTARSEFKH